MGVSHCFGCENTVRKKNFGVSISYSPANVYHSWGAAVPRGRGEKELWRWGVVRARRIRICSGVRGARRAVSEMGDGHVCLGHVDTHTHTHTHTHAHRMATELGTEGGAYLSIP